MEAHYSANHLLRLPGGCIQSPGGDHAALSDCCKPFATRRKAHGCRLAPVGKPAAQSKNLRVLKKIAGRSFCKTRWSSALAVIAHALPAHLGAAVEYLNEREKDSRPLNV